MTRNERLSLDEFATASSKKPFHGAADGQPPKAGISTRGNAADAPEPGNIRQEARKALRQVKRDRVKGENLFLNVSLDRQTKRRLKFASFNGETSMQEIAETAIVKYLDEIGA